MSDLWSTASRSVEAENNERKLTAARVAATSVWPFLSAAKTRADYENRKVLVAHRFEAAVVEAVGDEDADLALQLEASFDEDFRILHTANIEAARQHIASLKTSDRIFDQFENDTCPNCASTDVTTTDDKWKCNKCGFKSTKRQASKVAGLDDVCTVCGKPATKYAFQEGTRSSGYKACDAHIGQFSNGRTVEKISGLDNIPDDKKAKPFTEEDGEDDSKKEAAGVSDNSKLEGVSHSPSCSEDKSKLESKDGGLYCSECGAFFPDKGNDDDSDKKKSSLSVEAVSMTRQHFQHIADGIASFPGDKSGLAEHFANHLASTNAFDKDRFVKACQSKTAAKEDQASRLPFDSALVAEGGEKTAAFVGKVQASLRTEAAPRELIPPTDKTLKQVQEVHKHTFSSFVAQAAKLAVGETNPYLPETNKYIPEPAKPDQLGTPDDQMDGPVPPEPMEMNTEPVTTKPRQLPTSAPPSGAGPIDDTSPVPAPESASQGMEDQKP